jgi:DNA ligase-associated metallophosphoesterase
MLPLSRARPDHGFRFAGADLVADPEGALYWPAERTLIVADLHLEKGSSFAARGVLLPPYDTRAALERLENLTASRDVARVVCLGDSFHDRSAAARLAEAEAAALRRLTSAVDWIWIAGNHDPAPPAGLGGRSVADALRLGPLTLRHEALPVAVSGEISGHYHPKASIDVRGRRVSGRCMVWDERRLVLPAFGAYAGGLDVFDPALRRLFPGDFTVHLLARERITTLPHHRLAGAV